MTTCFRPRKIFGEFSDIHRPWISIEIVYPPWGPHLGFAFEMQASPTKLQGVPLAAPRQLPDQDFESAWSKLSSQASSCLLNASTMKAHQLPLHAALDTGHAIIGKPCAELVQDSK